MRLRLGAAQVVEFVERRDDAPRRAGVVDEVRPAAAGGERMTLFFAGLGCPPSRPTSRRAAPWEGAPDLEWGRPE